MNPRTLNLEQPFSLGDGRTIRPPSGWEAHGFVSGDDSLRLRPASQVRFVPPSAERLSLHWSKCRIPLAGELCDRFAGLLRSPFGVIKTEQLAPLHPGLIHIPLFRVTDAMVTTFARFGPLLEVHYFIAEQREAGIIWYAPTERFGAGEFQILAFEGKEPGFSEHLSLALKSAFTFCSQGEEAIPARRTGVIKSARKQARSQHTMVVKRLDHEDSGPLMFEYFIAEGESIRSIVKTRWPELSAAEQLVRVKEIYAMNRAKGNPLYAWDLKPGDKVLLPLD